MRGCGNKINFLISKSYAETGLGFQFLFQSLCSIKGGFNQEIDITASGIVIGSGTE